jgi:hypothetical protein
MTKVNIVYITPGNSPVSMTIDNDYDTIKKLIGGWIEIPPFFEDVDIIVDEEGKLKHLPLNKLLTYEGKVVDVLVGPIIIASYDEEGEMISLSAELADKYIKLFSRPAIELSRNDDLYSDLEFYYNYEKEC